MPIVLGHEAAGVVESVGPAARGVKPGDHVVLSWNPHCGHCFYCDRDLPILCEEYLGEGPKARAFDGESRGQLTDGRDLQHLMYLGSFGEYCIVPDQQAIVVPKEMPFDRACLIGCGVMTGVGAALNLGAIAHGDTVIVIGCGAVGLAAVQGARLAGAGAIIAVDLDAAKLAVASKVGATHTVNGSTDDPVEIARRETRGRGADVAIESRRQSESIPGHHRSCSSRRTGDLARQGGRPAGCRVSLGIANARKAHPPRQLRQHAPAPRLSIARARLSRRGGALMLDDLISRRIRLEDINAAFDALKRGETIRSVVTFD